MKLNKKSSNTLKNNWWRHDSEKTTKKVSFKFIIMRNQKKKFSWHSNLKLFIQSRENLISWYWFMVESNPLLRHDFEYEGKQKLLLSLAFKRIFRVVEEWK